MRSAEGATQIIGMTQFSDNRRPLNRTFSALSKKRTGFPGALPQATIDLAPLALKSAALIESFFGAQGISFSA
jgi:hypothetical protein